MINQSDRIGSATWEVCIPQVTVNGTSSDTKLCVPPHTSEESYLLTKLRIDKLEAIIVLFKVGDALLIKELGSQGFFQSKDGAYASSHESSMSTLSYYTKNVTPVRMPQGLNMDRGGVVARVDGGYSACIADGLSSEGYLSALTAQLVCYILMKRAAQEEIAHFTPNLYLNKKLAEDVFNSCASFLRQYTFDGASYGSTTALFVDCIPTIDELGQKSYRAQGGSLGDGAIIHICTAQKKAVQLNTITRMMNDHGLPDIRDAGGAIRSTGDIFGLNKMSEFNVHLACDDFLILVTDGFLDNVAENNVSNIVEIVMSCPLFDLPLDVLRNYPRFWEEKDPYTVPTANELREFILKHDGEFGVEEVLTAPIITKRLANYIKLVTYNLFMFKDAKLSQLADALDTIRVEKVSEDERLLAKNVAKSIRQELYNCDKANIAKPNSPKLDDCMIITLKPGIL